MRILGVDYGRQKIGLALGVGALAEPYGVIRGEVEDFFKKAKEIVDEEEITLIVVGTSEGQMAEESVEFAKKLQGELNIKVVTQDETLTSEEANLFAREAGVGWKKRKEMEDAYAATLILQNYLDNTSD